MKKYIGICGLAVAFLLIFTVSCKKKQEVVLKNYVSISYDGYDGYADIKIDIDKERLKNDLLSKNIMNEDEATKFLEALEGYANVKTASNGVGFKVMFALNDGSEVFPSGIDASGAVVKPENLQKAKIIDAFAGANVELKGISPKIEAEISGIDAEYEAEPSGFLKAGDVLKLKLKGDAPDGCLYKETEKEYVISDMTNRFPTVSEAKGLVDKLDLVCKDVIKSEADDLTKRLVFRMTGNKNYLGSSSREEVVSCELTECLYLVEKELKKDRDNNHLVLVYKVALSNDMTTEEGYFAFRLDNVYMAKDELKTGITKPVDAYICGLDPENLKKELIEAYESDYSINNLK